MLIDRVNRNSYICTYIYEHPDTWKEDFTNKHIKYKYQKPFCIFNYDIDCDFSDPIVQEARGIIIDMNTLEVACWPFRKFGNWNESYADTIDWRTARVQEKIDGSIIKVWWNKYEKCWWFSTNATINADDATCNAGMTFGELLRRTDDLYSIRMDILIKDFTYIFELISPYNTVVIKYDKPELYHIGTRSNITGHECVANIGIRRPYEYPLYSFKDCERFLEEYDQTKKVTLEGFVVVDNMYHRVKIKSPEYLTLHRMANNGALTKERCLEIVMTQDVKSVCAALPQYAHIIKYYDFKVAELRYELEQYKYYVLNLYQEVNKERKAIAMQIKNDRYASFGFKFLDNKFDINNGLTVRLAAKYIPDYVDNAAFRKSISLNELNE